MIFTYVASFIAMILAASSYFVKKKSFYLLFQLSTLIFLIISYFFSGAYVPMIGLMIGVVRTVIFFIYEEKNKTAPLFLAIVLAILTLIGCFLVNYITKKPFKLIDLTYLVSVIGYIFIFRIRNLKIVRFTILMPLILSILYNSIEFTTPFIIISYAFELLANVTSILKYHVFNKKRGGVLNEPN